MNDFLIVTFPPVKSEIPFSMVTKLLEFAILIFTLIKLDNSVTIEQVDDTCNYIKRKKWQIKLKVCRENAIATDLIFRNDNRSAD